MHTANTLGGAVVENPTNILREVASISGFGEDTNYEMRYQRSGMAGVDSTLEGQ